MRIYVKTMFIFNGDFNVRDTYVLTAAATRHARVVASCSCPYVKERLHFPQDWCVGCFKQNMRIKYWSMVNFSFYSTMTLTFVIHAHSRQMDIRTWRRFQLCTVCKRLLTPVLAAICTTSDVLNEICHPGQFFVYSSWRIVLSLDVQLGPLVVCL